MSNRDFKEQDGGFWPFGSSVSSKASAMINRGDETDTEFGKFIKNGENYTINTGEIPTRCAVYLTCENANKLLLQITNTVDKLNNKFKVAKQAAIESPGIKTADSMCIEMRKLYAAKTSDFRQTHPILDDKGEGVPCQFGNGSSKRKIIGTRYDNSKITEVNLTDKTITVSIDGNNAKKTIYISDICVGDETYARNKYGCSTAQKVVQGDGRGDGQGDEQGYEHSGGAKKKSFKKRSHNGKIGGSEITDAQNDICE
jgi:hypothetical protein